MAATHVYASVVRIPVGSGTSDDAVYTGASGAAGVGFASAVTAPLEATSPTFGLKGGLYGVECKASTYGTVTLQKLAQDGTTYLTVLTAFSADGYATAYLPPGTYKFTVA